MKSTVETLESGRISLSIDATVEDFTTTGADAFSPLASPWRVGRASDVELPDPVAEIIPALVQKASSQHAVRILGWPAITDLEYSVGEFLRFNATLHPRPNFHLPDLTSIMVTVGSIEVTEGDVDAEINRIRHHLATFEPVDRPARIGDVVRIDAHAAIDGEGVTDGQVSDVMHEVGITHALPGLDETLVGMRAGETKTVRTQLVGALTGKDADVTVAVASVISKKLPGLDDELAVKAGDFDSFSALRIHTREKLIAARTIRQMFAGRDLALREIVRAADISIPDDVIKDEAGELKRLLIARLESLGSTLEEYLTAEKETEACIEEEFRASALQRLQINLVLDTLVDDHDISISDNEIRQYMNYRGRRSGMPLEEYVRAFLSDGGLAAAVDDLRRGRVLAEIMASVTIVDGEGNRLDFSSVHPDVHPEHERQ